MKNLLIRNLSKDGPFHFCEGGGQWENPKANPYKAFAEEKKMHRMHSETKQMNNFQSSD